MMNNYQYKRMDGNKITIASLIHYLTTSLIFYNYSNTAIKDY